MLKVNIAIPLSSIPGVEVEIDQDEAFYHPTVESPPLENMMLLFEGEVLADYDFEDEQNFTRTRPYPGYTKLKKPYLLIRPYS
jgi:hypothetical protein